MTAKTKAQLIDELAVLQQRIAELEAEQQQREADLEQWLAAERENWALAEALHQTGAAIGSSLRGDEVLDRILDEMSRVVACDAACLLLIEGDVARVYRWRGYIRSGRATRTAIASAAFRIEGVPILRIIRETGQPLAATYPARNDEWVRKFGNTWVKSYAGTPIRNRGRVVGYLIADSETPGFFERVEAESLQAFADQAAMALENVGLLDRVRGETGRRVKALKKERNFISTILDTADVLVMTLNHEAKIIHLNRACERVSGYTFGEMKNRYAWDLLSAGTDTVVQTYFSELRHVSSLDQASLSLPSQFESYLITKAGERRLIAWSNAILFDKNGSAEYIIATGIDITEQRQAEAALRENEALLRATIEQVTVGINYASLDGKFFLVNDRFCQMLGYSPSELLTMSVPDVTHPDDLKIDMDYLGQMKAGKLNSYVIEKRYIRKDGASVWVNLSVSLVNVPARELKYAVAVIEDISERKQMEEELRRNHNFLQTLMDNLPVSVFVKSAEDGRFVLWNRASEYLFGILAEEALGRTDLDFYPKEQADFFRKIDAEVFAKQMGQDIPEELVDSRTLGRRILHTIKTPILDEHNNPLYLLGISQDITERKQAEETLLQSEATNRAILAAVPDLIFRLSRDGTYLDLSAPHTADLLLPPSDLLGKNLAEVLPADLAEQFLEAIEQVIQTGEPQTFEYQLVIREEIKYFEARIVWSGSTEVLTIVRNITDRKQAEEALRTQNEQLQARNWELDAFARTVAHDLKNPIGVLTTIAEILQEDYSYLPTEKLDEYLQTIARSGRRANRIVEALLLLAGIRQRNIDLQPLDMSTIVAETLQRLAPMITQYQAEIITPTVWPVAMGYTPWVEEVWVNYVSNGLKYGGRPPRLELGATPQPDGMIRFWLHDNGPGLSPKAQAQLFTEFTQLEQDRGEGHGLGLSIVRRIVEKLGGEVKVESEGVSGRGSIFSFTLPQLIP